MNLRELLSDSLNINEAFDAKFDSIEWEKFNDSFIGNAKLDNDEFKLYLEPLTFTVLGEKKVLLNVAFARKVNGQLSQDLINTGKNQSRQLGAIVGALRQKINELLSEIDAVVLIVEKGQEKRISLYKKLLMSKVYGIRPWQYRFSVEWFGGTSLVSSRELLTAEEKAAITKEVTGRTKQINWNS